MGIISRYWICIVISAGAHACFTVSTDRENAAMGGMSDVRLHLMAKELETGQHAKVFNAPAGLGRWGLMLHRWHTRRALLQLTDDELRDVGLSWEQAREEGRKPFWRD
jgi:uncharacterized protein YjiS (DUF1127 family)